MCPECEKREKASGKSTTSFISNKYKDGVRSDTIDCEVSYSDIISLYNKIPKANFLSIETKANLRLQIQKWIADSKCVKVEKFNKVKEEIENVPNVD